MSDAAPHKGRRLAARLGVALASALAALAVAEVVVDRTTDVGRVAYRLDDELLVDLVPGARRVQAMPADRLGPGDAARVHVAVNEDGFRGPPLADPKVAPRVLVLGDSFVMAENVPWPSTFTARLEAELAALGRDVEVVNAGRSGYGPDQALLLAREVWGRVEPDVVVLVVCAHNDFGDVVRNKLFRVEGDGSLERCRPELDPSLVAEFEERERRADALALVRLWRFRRDLADAVAADEDAARLDLVPLYLRASAAQVREHVDERDPRVYQLFRDFWDADVALDPTGESATAKRALLAAVHAELARLCAERDTPLLAVVVPSAVDVAPGFALRVDADRFPSYDPGRLVAAHLEALDRAGVEALDLTGHVLDAADPDALFVGGMDPHWNAAGQALGARVVAPRVAELLPEAE